MEISGENKCFVCGNNIRWQAHIEESGRTTAYSVRNSMAEAIAIGQASTTHGIKVQYDIIVKCPNCNNKNKFSGS